jgi:hypothetical protein
MAKARILHPRQFEAGKQQAIKIRELNSLDAVNNGLVDAAPSAEERVPVMRSDRADKSLWHDSNDF